MPSSPPTSLDLDEMLAQLLVGLVHVFERRARQLELAAGLETDRRRLSGSPVRRSAMMLPFSVTGSQPKRCASVSSSVPMPRSPVIGHRRVALAVEAELLVLGADAPSRWRLGTGFEIGDELVP